MSMHPEQEDFEQLRRLLALKRYEQPPPRYFNEFSRQVIVRIQAGDQGLGKAEGQSWDSPWRPWLLRLWGALNARPVLAGACSVAALAALFSAVLLSDQAVSQVSVLPAAAQPDESSGLIASQNAGALFTRAAAVDLSSASPSAITAEQVEQADQPRPSLFEEVRQIQAHRPYFAPGPMPQAVTYKVGGQ